MVEKDVTQLPFYVFSRSTETKNQISNGVSKTQSSSENGHERKLTIKYASELLYLPTNGGLIFIDVNGLLKDLPSTMPERAASLTRLLIRLKGVFGESLVIFIWPEKAIEFESDLKAQLKSDSIEQLLIRRDIEVKSLQSIPEEYEALIVYALTKWEDWEQSS